MITRKLLRNRQVVAGLLLVGVFVAVALFAPLISPSEPPQTTRERQYYIGEGFRMVFEYRDQRLNIPQPPTDALWFGTDAAQFDIFHTLIWGTRSALQFGIVVTLFTTLLGVGIGAISGYIGGWVQMLTLRVTDAFLTVPLVTGVWVMSMVVYGWGAANAAGTFNLLALLGITPTMLAFILFSWMPYARVMNATVLQLKSTAFIQASEALGATRFRIIFRHLIPNALSPIVVLMARDIGGVVTFASALQVINLGYASEWGTLLTQNRQWIMGISGNILLYWWVYLPITLAFVFFGVAWNLLGDGLNSVLNPKAA